MQRIQMAAVLVLALAATGCTSAAEVQAQRDRCAEARTRAEKAFVPFSESVRRLQGHASTINAKSETAVRNAEGTDAAEAAKKEIIKASGIADAQAMAIDAKKRQADYEDAIKDWKGEAKRLKDMDRDAGNETEKEIKQFERDATAKIAMGK